MFHHVLKLEQNVVDGQLVQVHTMRTEKREKEDDDMLVMRITKLPRGNGSPGQASPGNQG